MSAFHRYFPLGLLPTIITGICTVSICVARAQAAQATPDPAINSAPDTVLTPTRLRQALADVPASVTVVSADTIARLGIQSIVEALRLVPGMAITQADGNDYRVNYHGTNVLIPRRLNVLIDGMSMYRPGLARVSWTDLPISIDDVERIEVTRGSNSVGYGANSMMAVVNIITKHVEDAAGASVKVVATTTKDLRVRASLGRSVNASTAYSLVLESERANGFDFLSAKRVGHDGRNIDRAQLKLLSEIGKADSIEVQALYSGGTRQYESIDSAQRSYPDASTRDGYLSVRWKHEFDANHGLTMHAYQSSQRTSQSWITCPPVATFLPEMFALWRVNPALANSLLAGRPGTPANAAEQAALQAAVIALRSLGDLAAKPNCATANQKLLEERTQLELQDTYVFSDTLRMVAGAVLRRERGDSETLAGAPITNVTTQLFGNLEYKPAAFLNVNLGLFVEKDQLTSGVTAAPRLGVNWHVNDHNTLRFVAAKGTRNPDMQEQKGVWRYLARDLSVPISGSTQQYFYQSAYAVGGLQPERNHSLELGYYGSLGIPGVALDLRMYREQLSNLISEKLAISTFNPSNKNSVTLQGVEGQLLWKPVASMQVLAGGNYLENRNATSAYERSQYSSLSGFLSVGYMWENGWRTALTTYAANSRVPGVSSYGRQDFVLSKTYRFASQNQALIQLTVFHDDKQQPSYFRDVGTVTTNRLSHQWRAALGVQFDF